MDASLQPAVYLIIHMHGLLIILISDHHPLVYHPDYHEGGNVAINHLRFKISLMPNYHCTVAQPDVTKFC